MMMKSLLSSTVIACALAIPAVASGDPPARTTAPCPPGSWFCGSTPRSSSGSQTLRPLPDPDAPTPDAEHEEGSSAPSDKPPAPPPTPPVVVYEPPPPPPGFATPDEPPPYQYVRPRRHHISPPHEWGLNLHFEGALLGSGAQGNTSMGGVGAGLRFKPVRSFGLEADLDFAGGDHDYQGNKRSETAFMLNGLLFLNPESHAQIYLLAGIGWSGAHVTCDSCSTGLDAHYDYFGGQAGIGLELRLGRVLAFNADIRGFLRGRTDSLAQQQPEFDSPAGCSSSPNYSGPCRTTNTSGGGLMTGGMTLYF